MCSSPLKDAKYYLHIQLIVQHHPLSSSSLLPLFFLLALLWLLLGEEGNEVLQEVWRVHAPPTEVTPRRRIQESKEDPQEVLCPITAPYDPCCAPDPCPHRCCVCDGTFFPSLLQEMSAIVGCFNNRAQKLLEAHLASGFTKCIIWLKGNGRGDHAALMQEGEDLVTYALVNAIAIRKILKKYDKIHLSTLGQAFKSQAQSMHVEILKSPWLCELMAFHINLRETNKNSGKVTPLFEGCSLVFNNNKPSLSCEVLGLVKLEVDLTCSICLDTVFDSVSLTCGHIFCYMCACSAASVTIVDGLKVAEPKKKCPLCRESRVYQGAVHLDELNRLLSRSCPEYWDERKTRERVERVQQAKEHWESQCRTFMGT